MPRNPNRISLSVQGVEIRRALDRAVRQRIRRRAYRISDASALTNTEWSIVILDDEAMRSLNRQYRGKNETTDVLSFAFQEAEGKVDAFNQEIPRSLGEVLISWPKACDQAPDDDVEAELMRLIVHGFCHLRGFDHHRAQDRKRMIVEEERLLRAIGYEGSGLVGRSTLK